MAIAAGAISVMGFAPFGYFPLHFICLGLLFWLWKNASTLHCLWLGWAWGTGFFLAGVSWVYVSLEVFGGMASPLAALATLLFCAALALFPGLAGAAYARLRVHSFWQDSIVLAGVWTLSELLRGYLFTGFPWLSLGYAHTPPSPLAGYAPILGVYGISGIVAVLTALFVLDFRRWRPALFILLLFATGGVLLHAVPWTTPHGAPLTVSLLQGNIAQEMKWNPAGEVRAQQTYSNLAEANPAQLTVLPETAVATLLSQIPRPYIEKLSTHGAALFGVVLSLPNGAYANGAVLAQRSNSADIVLNAYSKRHLVPFGEYAPPGFSWFFTLAHIPMSNFSQGSAHQPNLAVEDQYIAVNICYEDLFGEEIITALPQATLLINMSNTAWFGDSLAQPQHLQISQMRAMESGRPMLRATNTGMTAVINPQGDVRAQLPAFTTGALTASVQGFQGATPFVYYGNALTLFLAVLALLPALIFTARNKKTTRRLAASGGGANYRCDINV